MKIFISSTIQDMKPERDAVTEVMNTLKQEISRSEFFVASEKSSKGICIQEAGTSDIFIGIYKNCYGSIPTDDNPNNYSVPEMEYNVARENNKRILIFIFSEEKDREPHLREFLEKIQNFTTGHLRKKYDNIDQLKYHVYASVQNIIQEKPSLPLQKNQNKQMSYLQDATEAKVFAVISKEKVIKLVDRILSSKSQEVRETACAELEKLANETKIWEHQEIWCLFDFLIADRKSQNDVRDGLPILKTMIQSAQQQLGKDNQTSSKVRQSYFDNLKELIYLDQQELRYDRLAAREILKSILNTHEFFILCYEAWKDGIKTIVDDKNYEEYIHVLVIPLENAGKEDKESVEEEIVQLMENKNPKIRKRAKDIHNLMY